MLAKIWDMPTAREMALPGRWEDPVERWLRRQVDDLHVQFLKGLGGGVDREIIPGIR